MSSELQKAETSKNRRYFGVTAKILGLVGFCLLLLCIVSAISIRQMSLIGQEIEGIAERDVPLTGAMATVTIHQLEQAINLERALRGAGLTETPEKAKKLFDSSLKNFKKLSQKVNEEIELARKLAESSISSARTEKEKKLFSEVNEKLTKIAIKHKEFDKHSFDTFEFVNAGDYAKARALLPVIKAEEDELDHSLEAVLFKVEKFTEHAANVAEEHEKSALFQLIGISALSILLGITITIVAVRYVISRPLAEVVTGLGALSKDDYSVNVKVWADDEIGDVAKAYGSFKDVLIRSKQLEADQAKLKEEADKKSRTVMLEIADGFEKSVLEIISSVTGTSTELSATSAQMSAIAEETSSQANAVISATESASSNVTSVETAAEHIVSSIDNAQKLVEDASNLTREAVDETVRTSDEMQNLSKAADRIGEVISMISDIADQTNLLALNATIESARAGEAGKGFAVVAAEVKDLAGQTTKASEEIISQIQDIQRSTQMAVESMGRVTEVIQSVRENSDSVSVSMSENSTSSRDITDRSHTASQCTNEVSNIVRGVTDASKETSTAAVQVSAAAHELSEQSNALQEKVHAFLVDLRERAADRRKGDDPNYKGPDRRKRRGTAADRAAA